jgi:hypothetical protein
MDISQLVTIIHSLGVSLKQTAPVHTTFLHLLEETNYKIQSTMQIIQSEGASMSLAEIQVYERCMNNLTKKLIQENISAVFSLLKAIEEGIKDKKRLTRTLSNNSEVMPKSQIKQICRLIRSELICNQDLLSTCQDYWGSLYRVMKYEDYFRKMTV